MLLWDVGRRRGAGLVYVAAQTDDLLNLSEHFVETQLGRRSERRIAAKDQQRLDRTLADRLNEITQAR